MKKIMITGGKGFFGSRFKKMWDGTYDVVILGSDDLDVTDELAVREIIHRERPDYVIHAAGIPNQQYCIEHPDKAKAVNVDGALYTAKASAETGAKFVFISTEQVFNGCDEPGPYTEETAPCPNTVYGENKWEVEQKLPEIIKEYWVVRFTWLFGLPERECKMGPNILWDTIDAVLKNKEIVTTEYEYRGMSDVAEICENMEKLFSLPYGTYHFGSVNDMGRYDVVKYILTLLGADSKYIEEKLIADNSKYSKENVRDLRLDTTKAAKTGLIFSSTRNAIQKCLKEFQVIK